MGKTKTFFESAYTRLLMLLMVLCICATAKADDLGALEIGKEYSLPMFKTSTATFTAPASGKVTLESDWSYDLEVKTEDGTAVAVTNGTGYFPVYRYFEAEEGKTYNLAFITGYDSPKVTISMAGIGEKPLELVALYPAEGGYYDLSSDGGADLQFTFNQPVTTASNKAVIYYSSDGTTWTATKRVTLSTPEVNGTLMKISGVQSTIIANIPSKIPEDSFIRIVVFGLQTASGQKLKDAKTMSSISNDHCYFEFKIGKLPTTISSAKYPQNFLSYWIPGTEDAQFEMTFSGDVKAGPNTALQIEYGDKDKAATEGYYVEALPFTIEGNKLTADLSGMLRTPDLMLPGYGTMYKNISIHLINILDKYDQPVSTGMSGSVGSMTYAPAYTLLEKADVACEFTPESGKSVLDKKEIKLWMTCLDVMQFTGFNLYCEETGETVVVAKADCAFADDGENMGEYTIAIPASMQGKKGITVTLDNLQAADGYDHSNDIRAVYDKFVVTFVSPEAGAQMEKLAAGTVINAEFNVADAYPNMVVVFDITDLNPENPDEAVIYSESSMTRQDDGTYQAEIFGNYKMMAGHQYKVTFYAWPTEDDKNYKTADLGSDYVIWEGLTLPYQYSELSLTEISPAEGERVPSTECKIVVKFDGLVKIQNAKINLGFYQNTAFQSVASASGAEYDNEWTLTVSDDFMKSLPAALSFSFQAVDEDGKVVKGNNGNEETSCFLYSYETAGQLADFEVALPNGGNETGEAVSMVIASVDTAIAHSGNVALSSAYVATKAGEKVAGIAAINETLEGDGTSDELNTSVQVVFTQAVTAPGAYVVYFPENLFNIGTEYAQFNSEEKYWEFSIVEPAKPIEIKMVTNPAEGVVTSLKTIEVFFPDYDEAGVGGYKIELSRDGVLLEKLEMEYDFDDEENLNKLVMNLSNEYTEAGNYKFAIPAGHVYLGSNAIAAPAMELNYTIEGGAVVEPSEYVNVNFSVGGYAGIGYRALKAHDLTVAINGSDLWAIDTLLLDGKDVTADVDVTGLYTIPAAELNDNANLEATFKFMHEINWDFSTGVEEVEGCEYKVYSTIDHLAIENLKDGDIVRIFSTNGMMLANNVATNRYMTVNLPSGVYIVMINDVALKVKK